MEEELKKQLELHSAGATIRHKSPFQELEHYSNKIKIENDFIKKWVVPFYMFIINNPNEFIQKLEPIKPELNLEIVKKLLGDFNWRTRIVGAYFASIMDFKEVEDVIGIHLLKSQVCFAGKGYCMYLAANNTQKGVDYLKKYLDYYLTRKDLYYNQEEAICALKWTDAMNGTNEVNNYLDLYNNWASEESNQFSNDIFQNFKIDMYNLNKIKMT